MTHLFQSVAIVGAGAMGQGIAQIVAQSDCHAVLYDVQRAAADTARNNLLALWQGQVKKGRISAQDAERFATRVSVAGDLAQLQPCELVVEAIVERLDVKVSLFKQLEGIVPTSTVLASNTSSLSIAAIGAGLAHPERFIGFHFFNPVALMKVVEVIAGLRTAPEVATRLFNFAQQLGHTAVMAKDSPGFIVNHAGRGYGTEALRVVSEGIADFATVDRILRDQAGFKMGPFELMDLTGLDVSQPVMESIYQQFYDEPRYRPSAIAAQRLAAGLTGRKVGEGFYRYLDGKAQVADEPPVPVVETLPPVWVSPRAARRVELLLLLKNLGAQIETGQSPSPHALTLVAPLGFDVTTVAVVERLDPARTVGIDMLIDDATTKRRVLATNPATRSDMRDAAHALFARDGKAVSVIRDSGGFVTQRVVAHIVNIASDICQQGICSPGDLEKAVTLGLGYPQGPLAMGNLYGPTNVLEVLFNMQTVYGDTRYRPSPWLRRRGAIGLSLLHEEA